MTEALRTVTFVGIALVLGVVAYVFQPHRNDFEVNELVGNELFASFDDPAKAAGLEIVRYDADLGEIYDFEVSRNKAGMWSIPSHSDYPADAEDQMRDAALCLVGLKVLGVATTDPSEHELFGVMEPDKDEVKLGAQGVGLLVRFQDDKGKDLADLIIGKQVKDSEEQRFVRVPGQSPVYAVVFDSLKLSTKFEDWIESDLLKLSTFDVERVRTRDYSLVQTTGGVIQEKRFDATVTFNSTDSKWELNELVAYRRQEGSLTQYEAVPTELSDMEELNNTKLNDLKSALGDLEIVDVRRKPSGLSAELTTGEDFLKDQETWNSLMTLGFYPADLNDDGQYELVSANGEVHVLMKDGYEYVLLFGNVTRSGESSADGDMNRYLFVTTRVDDSKFPQPELEELPQESTGGEAQDVSPTPGGDDESETQQEEQATNDQPADKTDDAEAESEGVATSDTQQGDQQDAAGDDDEEADPQAEGAGDTEEAERKLAAERERITKANQRKLDEWNENKRKAQEKVRELNSRFADWYYVVSEDVYKKIRLSRDDLVQESETAKAEGFGVDAFRDLQDKGLEQDAGTEQQ